MSKNSFVAAPLNTLWLRGSTPMDAGGVTGAVNGDRVFPPSPWTWQGMIRTRILEAMLGEGLARASKSEVAQMVGEPDSLPQGWRIRGPFPATMAETGTTPRPATPWVPWPRCIGVRSDGAYCGAVSTRYMTQHRSDMDGLVTSSARDVDTRATHTPLLRPGYVVPDDGWMSISTLRGAIVDVLAEAPGPLWRWDEVCWSTKRSGAVLPPFVAVETRTGLEIDENGRARDHMLYTAHHLRFRDGTGLWGDLEGAPDEVRQTLARGVAFAGKKSRAATLHQAELPREHLDFLTGAHLAVRDAGALEFVRVVLLTPAIADSSNLNTHGVPFNVPAGVTLLAHQAVHGAFIGGTNWVAGSSRPLAATFAPGSAWLFHLPNADTRVADAQVLAGVHTSHLTDAERFGFGQRVVAPLAATMILNEKELNP